MIPPEADGEFEVIHKGRSMALGVQRRIIGGCGDAEIVKHAAADICFVVIIGSNGNHIREVAA